MRRSIERFRRRLTGLPRLLAPVVALTILGVSLFAMVGMVDVVTVTDEDGQSQTLMTNETDAEEIVELAGIATAPADEVVYTRKENAAADIEILRAFPVSVTVDGLTLEADMVDGDVAEALETCGVKVGPEDIVTPAAGTDVAENMCIQVARVTHKEEALARQEISDEDVEAYLATLSAEEQESFKRSNRSMYDVTYHHTLVDGEVSESEIIQLNGLILPREPGSTAFDAGVPCSRIEGYDDIAVDENGVPTNYTRLMSSAICTAYSASRGKGSSGLGLYNGTVAVNPNVIPYGTRMYITSSDGNFVYGYAIATDTGTAMMEGRVDIDLFFETNAECLKFGKRSLDVYILD